MTMAIAGVDSTERQEPEKEGLKDGKTVDQDRPSPRGVLEIPPLSPSSVHGSSATSTSTSTTTTNGGKSSSSSFGYGKRVSDNKGGVEGENNGLLWKNLVGQIKKKSVMKFPGIPFLGWNDLASKSVRRRLGRNQSAEETIDCMGLEVPKPSWRNFKYKQLLEATDNFNPDNMIGEGGHAQVYKGHLSDGQVVAVKKITKMEKTNEDRVADFLSELGIIAHVNHPNAVKLIGFSVDNGLHLVLQFLPHGSLATLLHGSSESIEWKIRFRIAVGVAKGLHYLHSDCPRRIIHRDITASNILLDEDYKPQISDFGLAKWLPQKWSQHVVSPIEGTFGYMAPEYFMHGVVHEKTDVFAFGVLLLELMTGRHAVYSSQQSLVMWAKPLLEENNVKELLDSRLEGKYDTVEVKRAMSTASACLRHLPDMRPTMKKVVQFLKGEHKPIDMKAKSIGARALLVDACDLEDYTSTTYLNDLNRHKQLVME